MKIVIASDSFKGSISSEEINNCFNEVVKENGYKCELVPFLIADGGDGTLDAIIKQKKGRYIEKEVFNPLFKKIKSRFGIYDSTAVISLCECSGLTLIDMEDRNPCLTTTYGCGELINEAIKHGVKHIVITLGGSATNDGGIGALTALGYKFIKKDGTCCKGIGEELIDIVSIDDSEKINFSGIDFTILSDVTNPLTGIKGATNVFAKQKGATNSQIDFLEKGMLNFEKVLNEYTKKDISKIIGGGAAGGIGASLMSILNAKIQSGIDTILDMIDFEKEICDSDVIFTGEGKIDSQSKDGKAISGVLKYAKKYNLPVIAIVGTIGEGVEELYSYGLISVFSLIEKPSSLSEILKDTTSLYKKTVKNILNLLFIKYDK